MIISLGFEVFDFCFNPIVISMKYHWKKKVIVIVIILCKNRTTRSGIDEYLQKKLI